MNEARQPNAIDIHVGARIRSRRKMLDISQQQLAEAAGVTFQQVQKYEKGANRVSCSKLVEIAKALSEHPTFVFEGLDLTNDGAAIDEGPNELLAFFADHGGATLARAFRDLSPALRLNLISIAKTLTGEAGAEDRQAA